MIVLANRLALIANYNTGCNVDADERQHYGNQQDTSFGVVYGWVDNFLSIRPFSHNLWGHLTSKCNYFTKGHTLWGSFSIA